MKPLLIALFALSLASCASTAPQPFQCTSAEPDICELETDIHNYGGIRNIAGKNRYLIMVMQRLYSDRTALTNRITKDHDSRIVDLESRVHEIELKQSWLRSNICWHMVLSDLENSSQSDLKTYCGW